MKLNYELNPFLVQKQKLNKLITFSLKKHTCFV